MLLTNNPRVKKCMPVRNPVSAVLRLRIPTLMQPVMSTIILVFEPDQIQRETMVAVLRQVGVPAIGVANAPSAMGILQGVIFNVLILPSLAQYPEGAQLARDAKSLQPGLMVLTTGARGNPDILPPSFVDGYIPSELSTLAVQHSLGAVFRSFSKTQGGEASAARVRQLHRRHSDQPKFSLPQLSCES